MTIFYSTTKTGDIVTKFPKASRLFKEHKIDFCCGGNRPIGEVLEEKGLSVTDILGHLNDMYENSKETNLTNWKVASYREFVEFIINRYHIATREILEDLSPFVTKVSRVHGERHPHLLQVCDSFFQLKEELLSHLADEEAFIFPYIVKFEEANEQEALIKAKEMITKLEADHEAAGDLLSQIRTTTNDYQLPLDACKTYELTYLKLQELESMTFDHVHLENNILFPRVIKA